MCIGFLKSCEYENNRKPVNALNNGILEGTLLETWDKSRPIGTNNRETLHAVVLHSSNGTLRCNEMLRPARRLVYTGVEYTWTTADLLDQTFVCVYVNDKTD